MKQIISTFGAIVFFLCSCSSQYPSLSQGLSIKCEELRAACSQKKINSPESTVADSLYMAGETFFQKGKHKDAYLVLESAATYYRLALSKDDLKNVDNELARLKKSLADAEEKLGMYQEVLKELETMEQP
ncbi:MAG: hypothetical protein GF350_05835 [Chitinivibrionales bacterium]|nr:hypothetical protein [Chitinivibrionales bacterium]